MPKKYKATITLRKYTKVFRGKTIKRRNAKPKKKAKTIKKSSSKKHYVGGMRFPWNNRLTLAERQKKEDREREKKEEERKIIGQSEDIEILKNILNDYNKEVESRSDELDKLNADLEKYNKKKDSGNANMVISQMNNVLSKGEYYATMIEKIKERIKHMSETEEDPINPPLDE